MHVRAGDRVEFVEIEPGRYEFIAATRPVTALKGMFGKGLQAGVDRADERYDRSGGCGGEMIGLDTNVLVRYIMQDDAAQSAKASALLDALTVDAPGWISIVSVIELVWVLGTAAMAWIARNSLEALEALLRTKELIVERAEVVWKAVRSCPRLAEPILPIA